MNREDQNFDQLRRLLKLKRYEQPPPRYFKSFSTQVVARLRSGQSSDLSDNWLQRLWRALELKPIVPAAFGAAICGLLVAGAVYTDGDNTSLTGLTAVTLPSPRLQPDADPIPVNPLQGLLASSTNPVPAGSLFDQIRPGGNLPPMRAAHPLFQ
jgi:hypothetical protein